MNLESLIVCRNLLENEIFSPQADEFQTAANLIEKAEQIGLSGNIFRSYLIYALAHEPNLISETIESSGGKIGESLREAFKHDLEILFGNEPKNFLPILKNYQPTEKFPDESFVELEKNLENRHDAEKISEVFIEHYRKFGYGDIAAYRAFRWENKLVGIKHFEKILLEDLIGYAHQKELLTANTKAFLAKKPANNVLLVGARGTGKSSGVKALVNEYYSEGLRLLQITKPQLKNLPEIMDALRKFAGKRFIIFLDDLSFEESEAEYKYLK